jgi:hypothetical protein
MAQSKVKSITAEPNPEKFKKAFIKPEVKNKT